MFEKMGGPGRHCGPHGHRGMGAGHGHRRGFPMGPFPGFVGRGPLVRRGDVRSAILALLAERPMHGYQIMGELEARSGGMWRPSAGSVYPTLQQLEDEGLVRVEERDGRRVFSLTEAGREQATSRAGESGAPWEMEGTDARLELRDLIFQLGAATMQVAQVGSPEQVAQAKQLLAETRRRLYRLLAEEDADQPTPGPGDTSR